jgi:hypothetical protein
MVDLPSLQFDIADLQMKPYPLVRYKNHPNWLKDEPVTLIVHPLLEIYGTDEGEDYDNNPRILMPAEVWLESSTHTNGVQPSTSPSATPQGPPSPGAPPPSPVDLEMEEEEEM